MRKILILMIPLLLAGCIKQSASYYISDARDHAITVRAEQEYFWDDAISLSLVAAHLPACQRAIQLARVPRSNLTVELFSSGEGVFTLKSGPYVVQVDTQTCTQLPEPGLNALGEAVGVFRLSSQKMGFEPAPKAASPTA